MTKKQREQEREVRAVWHLLEGAYQSTFDKLPSTTIDRPMECWLAVARLAIKLGARSGPCGKPSST